MTTIVAKPASASSGKKTKTELGGKGHVHTASNVSKEAIRMRVTRPTLSA